MYMTEISPYAKAGALIRVQREAKGLTQLDVVKAMAAFDITTSEPALSRLEFGENKRVYTNTAFMNALAHVLDLDVIDIRIAAGQVKDDELKVNPRTRHIIELLESFDPETLDTAERLLRALASKQSKSESS